MAELAYIACANYQPKSSASTVALTHPASAEPPGEKTTIPPDVAEIAKPSEQSPKATPESPVVTVQTALAVAGDQAVET